MPSRTSNTRATHLSPVDGIGPRDWVLQVFSADGNDDQGDGDLPNLDAAVEEQQAQELQAPSEEVDAALVLQGAVPVADGEAEAPYDDHVA